MSATQSSPPTEHSEGDLLLQKTMRFVFQYLPLSVINAAVGKLRCHSSSRKNVNVTSFREREREKKERKREWEREREIRCRIPTVNLVDGETATQN